MDSERMMMLKIKQYSQNFSKLRLKWLKNSTLMARRKMKAKLKKRSKLWRYKVRL